MNLYQLSNELESLYHRIIDSVDEETGEIDTELANALTVKEEEFDQKAIGVAIVGRRLNTTVDEIDAEIERLTALKKVYKARAERLENAVATACERFGKTKIDGIGARISFRKSERVVIDNETEIPDEFIDVKMTKKPSLTRIKDAIKQGQDVKGARIETVQNLQIK